MGFGKVRDALTAYFDEIPFCKAVIKFIDVIAAVITVLLLINQFFSLGEFVPALLPYALWITVILAIGAKGKMGLLISAGGQMLIGFINLTRGMLSFGRFSWSALFGILFWGMLTFFVVVAINNEGMGHSVLTNMMNSSSQKKGPARFCLSCGAQETNLDSGFCRTCGAKLPDISAVPAAPAAPVVPVTPVVPAAPVVPVPAVQETAPVAVPAAVPTPAVQQADSEAVVCPKCGKQGDGETIFCSVCGTKIK